MAILPEDPERRKYVLLGLLALGALSYVAYEYLWSPRADEIGLLEQRVEVLELQNRTARAVANRAGEDEVEARMALYRNQLEVVEGLIPSSEEVPVLLNRIMAEARAAGVDIDLIDPVAAVQEEFYTRRVYELSALGTYHQIGDFLARVGSLQRIITPIQLSIRVVDEGDGEEDPRLEARFSIETYVVAPMNGVRETDDEL